MGFNSGLKGLNNDISSSVIIKILYTGLYAHVKKNKC
jgi:hypothetical protein